MSARDFHLGDLLSISDGRLVSPRHMDGIYDILNWMAGDSLFTHQLPRAMQECRPHLIKQHPWLESDAMSKRLAALTVALGEPCDPKHVVEAWLADAVTEFGEVHPIEPVPEAHEPKDPIEELREMMPGKPVVSIRPPERDA